MPKFGHPLLLTSEGNQEGWPIHEFPRYEPLQKHIFCQLDNITAAVDKKNAEQFFLDFDDFL